MQTKKFKKFPKILEFDDLVCYNIDMGPQWLRKRAYTGISDINTMA